MTSEEIAGHVSGSVTELSQSLIGAADGECGEGRRS